MDQGWDGLDVILVTGDAYIDSSYIGVAVIGKVLLARGYRVGIIAQPDLESGTDIARMGEPELFWGVTGGCVDSMVSNYTAMNKPRREDDLTAGGRNVRRPDRACIAYTNLIRHYFRHTVPIVLGGIEASLRRIAHYDYWSDSVRRSILLDAKADLIVYGMGESTVVELADHLRQGKSVETLRGTCFMTRERREGYVELPDYPTVATDKRAFAHMFMLFSRNNDPLTAKGLQQRYGDRYLTHNPPAMPLSPGELDRVYELDYERAVHPYYAKDGEVRALETIRSSITSHRGCYGECNFCAISPHQGRTVVSRSEASIIREAGSIASQPWFNGIIFDVGGPTANMYGFECSRKTKVGGCSKKRCLFPAICGDLSPNHSRQIELLRRLRRVPGVKRVFIGSGVRYDLILADECHGEAYLRELVAHHVSGQLKVAPEHCEHNVLKLMGKPSIRVLGRFRARFQAVCQQAGKKYFLTYYFVAAYPGCTEEDMRALARFARDQLHHRPEQVQIFTPTPSSFASLIYWTEEDPVSGEHIFVEKSLAGKQRQKLILRGSPERNG